MIYKNILIYIWIWAICNLLIGIWEIYVYFNRFKLILEKTTLWEKIDNNQINIKNFWIKGWSEYTKVDSRYIIKPYVWIFELLNAIISIIFITILLGNGNKVFANAYSISSLKILLAISICNCLLYFITLFWEYIGIDNNDNNGNYNNNNNNNNDNSNNLVKENIKNYAQLWMLPTYYLISGIWLIVPTLLYLSLGK